MADDEPRLRLVGPDERAPATAPVATDRAGGADDPRTDGTGAAGATTGAARDRPGLAGIVPLTIGIAILLVGLALSLRMLMAPTSDRVDDAGGIDRSSATTGSASGDPTLLPAGLATTTTSIAATSAPVTSVPSPTSPASGGQPGLLGVPVEGGAPGPAPAPPPPSPAATGSARIRIFNGFEPGQPLDVWEVASGTPVRYGTIGFGELKEMVIDGQRLPGGVAVNLRFVVPGGDPLAATGQNGTWWWDFTPPDGSANTIFLTENDGMRVLRVDHDRVQGEVPAGGVHVVPVVFHLRLQGKREKAWSADGFGCIGHTTIDKQEFDVVTGTALRLAVNADGSCSAAVSDAAVLDRSTAVAVVGLETTPDTAHLVVVPFD